MSGLAFVLVALLLAPTPPRQDPDHDSRLQEITQRCTAERGSRSTDLPRECRVSHYAIVDRDFVLEPQDLSVDAVHVRAQLRYQRQQFSAAAAIVREALAQMPDSAELTELESLATLYDQLAAAWALGMDPTTPPMAAFPALREAWKLDTVLGGSFTDPLYARLAEVAPEAALAFVGRKDYVSAELALHTAQTLGVTSASLDTASAALAKRR